MAYCLNYSKTNDTLSVGDSVQNSDLIQIFESYEDKGYDKNRPCVTVGESGFTFTIETNFGYGKKSFLRFRVEYNGNILYCFRNRHGEYNHAIPSPYFNFEPEPESWDKLFTTLCYVYNNKEYWNVNECLKWLDIRIASPIQHAPAILTQSFHGFVEMLIATGVANYTPVMEKTEIIIANELPILSKIIIKEDNKPQRYEYSIKGIVSSFKFLNSIGRIDIFIRALQNNKALSNETE